MKAFLKKIIKLIFFNNFMLFLVGNLYRYIKKCSLLNYEKEVKGKYNIHSSVRWTEGTSIYGTGHISIGEDTYLGRDCYIASFPAEAKIIIGKNCAIAHNVHVRTSNYARVPEFKDAFEMPSEWADIVIGDYCWIGSHVYINAGVVIGENCIIGANSVVTHNVEPNSVVGGVPARLIHKKDSYQSKK